MLVHATSWRRPAPVIGGPTRMAIHAGGSLAGKLSIEASDTRSGSTSSADALQDDSAGSATSASPPGSRLKTLNADMTSILQSKANGRALRRAGRAVRE